RDPELRRELFVAHVFRPRDLHFEIVITGAKRADLVVAAINRAVADFRCVCTRDAAILLGDFEVFVPAVTVLDAPARPLLNDFAKGGRRDVQETVTANARWYALEKKIDDFFHTRLHVIEREVGDNQAHTAVDVESDATGRDHAALVHVHRCDATNGKPVTAMAGGHAKRVAADAGQCGDVTDLLVNGFVHFAHQLFCRNDARRHAHPVLVRYWQFPNSVRNLS